MGWFGDCGMDVNGTSDVIEKRLCFAELRACSYRERYDGQRQVPAERDEPSGNEGDQESPEHADDDAGPRDTVAREVLIHQLQRESPGARTQENNEGKRAHYECAGDPRRDAEGGL